MSKKKLLFVTGTRADFGKLKSILTKLRDHNSFDIEVFVTGMHMLSKYGSTYIEVERCKPGNIYKFINQNDHDSMDTILAKTVLGLSDYIKESIPDMIIVHGDRVEAMAGAIVGSLNNILVSHIEGGEVSGTIDELIRHSVSKLSHIHFVANEEAKSRLRQLGEIDEVIHVIGSPDIDIMKSPHLPSMDAVREKYAINFLNYSVAMFHPVTTEYKQLRKYAESFVEALLQSNKNYVLVYPNNDLGSKEILEAFEKLKGHKRFRIFPSMRFEYFITLLKNTDFVIGNSSAGIREAPYFGVSTVNVGTRQNNRASLDSVISCDYEVESILQAILKCQNLKLKKNELFGDGNSDQLFVDVLSKASTWSTSHQKYFKDFLKD